MRRILEVTERRVYTTPCDKKLHYTYFISEITLPKRFTYTLQHDLQLIIRV